MKRVFIFLAEITGAADEIRKRQQEDIGRQLESTSYWFTATEKYWIIYPLLRFMSQNLLSGGRISGDFSRNKADQLINERANDAAEKP